MKLLRKLVVILLGLSLCLLITHHLIALGCLAFTGTYGYDHTNNFLLLLIEAGSAVFMFNNLERADFVKRLMGKD